MENGTGINVVHVQIKTSHLVQEYVLYEAGNVMQVHPALQQYH